MSAEARDNEDMAALAARMNADTIREQRAEIARLRTEIALLRWRADRAEDFLRGYGSAPLTATEVLRGGYDHEREALSK